MWYTVFIPNTHSAAMTELFRCFLAERGMKMADIFELFKKIGSGDATPQAPIGWIVAGLGNPDRQYIGTRHNVGFTALDYYASHFGVAVNRQRFQALTGEGTVAGQRVLFMKPLTYMNNSGIAIREAADFYKIAPDRILVVFDDISLDPGKMRIRSKGSAGGHNGIKSIIYHLNSDGFPRIKLGVGNKPHPEYDLVDWVLGHFSEEDGKAVTSAIRSSADALELILQNKFDEAMNRYN